MGITSQDVDDNVTIQDGAGSGRKADVTTDNRLKVEGFTDDDDLKDFFLQLGKGNIAGHSQITKFGANPDADSGTSEDVWDGGGIYPFPSSAQTTTIKSTSASDTSAGTGARTVKVFGLDSNWDEIEETVTMNGTTSVTLTNSYLRCYRAYIVTAGSDQVNQGDIEIQHGSTTIAQISAEKGQTLMAIYTIPNAKTGYLFLWHAEIGKQSGGTGDKEAEAYLDTVNNGAMRQRDFRIISSQNSGPFTGKLFRKFEAKTDVLVRVQSRTNNSIVTAGFELILVDD